MLIQFMVRNFKTFKDKASLSLVASNYDKDTKPENIHEDSKFNLRILKSTVIYGANASGKSKFIEALMFMKELVINSSKFGQTGDKIPVEPFLLSNETEHEPSEFEVVFTYKEVMYRYGFEVDQERVVSEWLYHRPKTKEIELFYRDYQQFEAHNRDFAKGATIIKAELIRENALMLSVAAQFNEKVSVRVIDWFKNLDTISGLNESFFLDTTIVKTKEPKSRAKILALLKGADLGIEDIRIKPNATKGGWRHISLDVPVDEIFTAHRKYDKEKNQIGSVDFSLEEDESFGTRKFFSLMGPVLDALENGCPLVVDELDSRLHPNLVTKIVGLFNSKEKNPKNAQLIFNTHDTNLLSAGLFRRDQVWFTEKNKYGEGSLYSLADFKSTKVRKTEAFEDNYIRGKYGAVPFLGFFDDLVNLSDEKEG